MAFPSELKEHMSTFNDEWQRAVRTSGDELPPDGLYQALVERFEPFQANAGGWFLKTEFRIQFDQDWDGKIVPTIHSLDDPGRAKFLVKHLRTMGLSNDELEDLANVDEHLPKLLDVPVLLAVVTSERINEKTGLPFRNVYCNERLGDPLKGQAASDVPADDSFKQPPLAATDDDESTPF